VSSAALCPVHGDTLTHRPVSRKLGRWGGAAHCVYCGRRCATTRYACHLHADLPSLDPRYSGRVVHCCRCETEAWQAARRLRRGL
jgi:hypothetical protein